MHYITGERRCQLQAIAFLAWDMACQVGGESGPIPPPSKDVNLIGQTLSYLDRVRVLPKYAARCDYLEDRIHELVS